ncbi:hypothetical protein KR032_010081 [Drosophila birchii]|nr:hypothetical protein KR032_010081 [Drosophila birchii]
MWNYRQDIQVDTSIKISPLCHEWPSVCWFALNVVKTWKFLAEDLHPALSFMLVSLIVLAVISVRLKWKERACMIVLQESEPESLPLEDLEHPLVTKVSLHVFPESTDTVDKDELEMPLQKQPKTMAKTNQQMKPTKIPVSKGVGMVKRDQPQATQKAVPSKRSPALPKTYAKPNSRKMGSSIPRDLNQNPGRAARQSDIRSSPNTIWKL